jgi:hypothetical protein
MNKEADENVLCPCGSGIERKRCHGSIVDPATAPGNLPLDATETKATLMGFPGQLQQLHVMNQFPPEDPRSRVPPIGTHGTYEVIFILKRPGFPLVGEYQLSFSQGLTGNSHLAVPRTFSSPDGDSEIERVLIQSVGDDGRFEFVGFLNERRFLGKFVSGPFQARDRFNAEEIAYRALAPSLSEFSLQLDIPLEIAQIETKDLFTENCHVTLTVPFPNTPMAITPSSKTPPDFRGVASLYREALNSSSPVYQFLCLFKIIEALRARRKKLEREAKRNGTGQPPTAPVEMLPTSYGEIRAWLDSLFYARPPWDLTALEGAVPPEARGKSFNDVISNLLNPLRANVAHALFEDAGNELTISYDDLIDTRKIAKLVPLTKCIARRMLKSDFPAEFLPHLPLK